MLNEVNICHIDIDEITLLDENPRDITDSDLQKLANDIKEDPDFFIQRPPLINFVDGNYICYAGTQRIKAQKLNGETKVRCFVEYNVPKHIQDKRMVIDNLHRGKWNEDKLMELDFELSELQDLGFQDFEVSLFNEVIEPTNLTAPYKEAPPTMKITFVDTRQMDFFESKLKTLIEENKRLESVTYSVSQGEI